MRHAVIDIGTNTVKLLVADVSGGEVVAVASKDQTTRLGQGLDQSGRLSREAIDRSVEIIDAYLAEARKLGATQIRAVTTSAAREATNREDFLQGVRDQCGLEVEVISGEQESELIFRGVTSDSAWAGHPIIVADVGGGSAEFIQGCGGRIERHQSLSLGAVRLTERFGRQDQCGLEACLRESLASGLAGYDSINRPMIATGGTIVTLAAVDILSRREPAGNAGGRAFAAVDHAILSQNRLRELVAWLHAMPLAQRQGVPGLSPDRADIIVAGGMVFVVAMELLGVRELTVSLRGLRYGALVGDRS